MLAKVVIIVVLTQVLNFLITVGIPMQKCSVNSDCISFCNTQGYNKSDCSTRLLRLNRLCECSECDIVRCATFCVKKHLKFVGCNCFNLPANNLPVMENSMYNPNTNDCAEDKFFCQCSK